MPFKTHGFLMDALVYKQNLNGDGEIFVSSDSPQNADVNLFIDRVMETRWFDSALINVLMVNQEVILAPHLSSYEFQREYLKSIDFALCKTNYGLDFMKKIKEKYGYRFKLVLVNHTTIFPTLPKTRPIERDYSRVLHSAGTHNWKNTDTVIKCWLRYGREMDLPKLIVTCHAKCLKSLRNYLSPQEYHQMFHHDLIKFYPEALPFKELVALKHQIGIHLCPSMAEGYGHYLNEARITKALIITTDLAPMNELVTSESGLLLECSKVEQKTNGNFICFIDPLELARVVQKADQMSQKQRELMGSRAYQDYLEDTREFKVRIGKFEEKMEDLISGSKRELDQKKKKRKTPSKKRKRSKSRSKKRIKNRKAAL